MSPSHYPYSSLERTPYEKKDKLEKRIDGFQFSGTFADPVSVYYPGSPRKRSPVYIYELGRSDAEAELRRTEKLYHCNS